MYWQPQVLSCLQQPVWMAGMHLRNWLQVVALHVVGGGAASGGAAAHDPAWHTWPLLWQFSHAFAPEPHVDADCPPAQKPCAVQHPPQLAVEHRGTLASASPASSGSPASLTV
jgi:hypothetical protein